MGLHHFVEIIHSTSLPLGIATHTINKVCPRKYVVSRKIADSRTTGIFMLDTTYFHCDLLSYKSQFIE